MTEVCTLTSFWRELLPWEIVISALRWSWLFIVMVHALNSESTYLELSKLTEFSCSVTKNSEFKLRVGWTSLLKRAPGCGPDSVKQCINQTKIIQTEKGLIMPHIVINACSSVRLSEANVAFRVCTVMFLVLYGICNTKDRITKRNRPSLCKTWGALTEASIFIPYKSHSSLQVVLISWCSGTKISSPCTSS